jgi:hypothetical protein
MSALWLRYPWVIRSRPASLLFAAAVLLFLGCLIVAMMAKDTSKQAGSTFAPRLPMVVKVL